jgi:hypothetical protein
MTGPLFEQLPAQLPIIFHQLMYGLLALLYFIIGVTFSIVSEIIGSKEKNIIEKSLCVFFYPANTLCNFIIKLMFS